MPDPGSDAPHAPSGDDVPGSREGLATLGLVIIGRNEGERLRACLESIPRGDGPIVYVDSASSDGSVALAAALGVEVVELDPDSPLSAARARNAGFERLLAIHPEVELVLFMDGDCELEPGWREIVIDTFEHHPDVVAVCGRRKEKHPEATPYNRICDVEWALPPAGPSQAFGGEVAIRVESFRKVGGYDPGVVAAEDDELAVRLRAQGGKILRLEDTSSRHDAAMTSLAQWWQRAVRAGHGYAQVYALHGGPPTHYWRREYHRICFYGGALPIAALACAPVTGGTSLFLFLAHVLQFLRLVRLTRKLGLREHAVLWSASTIAGQLANFVGVLRFHRNDRRGRAANLIEYKGSRDPG